MYDVTNMPDLVVRYFSSIPWLVVFILSTVYLFFRLSKEKKRAMLIVCVVFFCVVNSFVIGQFTKLGENSTFYRHLWAVPSIVIVGIAVIDLVRIVPKWYLKIPVIVAMAIGLWFINEQEYIRCRIQIFSTDGTLVPEDVIEIGDGLEELRNEIGKNTLFVICPSGYDRPYGNMVTELGLYNGGLKVSDSSILNDGVHNGEDELLGNNPDVNYIMATCCSSGIDYVIVNYSEDKKEIFGRYGHEPVLRSKSYMIYRCEGHDGLLQDTNEWGQIIKQKYYDAKGDARCNRHGFAEKIIEYDRHGYVIQEKYLGIKGELVKNSDGYAVCEYVNTSTGLIVSKIYRNEKEEPIQIDGRFVTGYEYGDNGIIEKESYYDQFENPMNRVDTGISIVKYKYDEKDQQIEEWYYNKEGNLTISATGYAGFIRDYNSDGLIVRETYYDENKSEVASINNDEQTDNNMMSFLKLSTGVGIDEDKTITFNVPVKKNEYNYVYFEIHDAQTDEWLAGFGGLDDKGVCDGTYEFELPSGLYNIVLKANTELKGESVKSLVNLHNGDLIAYHYEISSMLDDMIYIENLSVRRIQ